VRKHVNAFESYRLTDRQTDGHTYIHTYTNTHTHAYIQAYRQTYKCPKNYIRRRFPGGQKGQKTSRLYGRAA